MHSLQFESDLDFQREAVCAVTDIFRGCDAGRSLSPFTVEMGTKRQAELQNAIGHANTLELPFAQFVENIHGIQLRNGLPQSPESEIQERNFSIWMETGTGKTYVYLRTIFELHKLYRWTKFIVVVPSIAIKEGVRNALSLMSDHLRQLYDNTPYDSFVYDSQNLAELKSFALSDALQIMIINIDAFKKVAPQPDEPGVSSGKKGKSESKANIINRQQEQGLEGRAPIELIAECRPVVILDEPQSIDNTEKAKEAIRRLRPLCTLRYSATHRKKDYHCMMYRLDSVDAYERKLVKQIQVKSLQVEESHNRAYIRLVGVSNAGGTPVARVEIDRLIKGKAVRKTVTARLHEDFFKLSGNNPQYDGMQLEDIDATPGNEHIRFLNSSEELRVGQTSGGDNDEEVKRRQIRETIHAHLEKELLFSQNHRKVKVLSLFFIDRVANYRATDAEGMPSKGKYALWFEEEYRQLIANSRYSTLWKDVDTATPAEQVHDGYFSIDKKGRQTDTSEKNQSERENAQRGYELIMKDKTRLLSFECPVRFIFSHSALKEGWDNPNVFQICTLNEVASDMRRRQMIGRGLRICVDQEGRRIYDPEVNVLTVMANESFEAFAENLQREIEEDEQLRFGRVEAHSFANLLLPRKKETDAPAYFGGENSESLFADLKKDGYLDAQGRVQPALKTVLKEGTLAYPLYAQPWSEAISALLKKICGSLEIVKRASEPARTVLRKERFVSPAFQELWKRIQTKTTYRVNFDTEELVKACAEDLRDRERFVVCKPKFHVVTSTVAIGRGGIGLEGEQEVKLAGAVEDKYDVPDVLSYLQNATRLTRKTLFRILDESGRLEDLRVNPQMFLDNAVTRIRAVMQAFLVKGIEYRRIPAGDGDEFWQQQLFEEQPPLTYETERIVETPNHGLYDKVVCDSEVERRFAQELEHTSNVEVFAKLPAWFQIPTPLGNYNPDWAVLVRCGDVEKALYLVVETKATDLYNDLAPAQREKIDCGKAHFHALAQSDRNAAGGGDLRFVGPVATLQDVLNQVAGE